MKIFSLKSKIILVVWSVAGGFVINYLISLKNLINLYNCQIGEDCIKYLKIYLPFTNPYIDWLFWSTAIFVILFFIRHFKSKENQQLLS